MIYTGINMVFQPLFKPLNRWTIIAIMVATTALTGATVYYGISQMGQTAQPSEPAQIVPIIKQITALERLEPASEIVRVSAPVTLNKDRVAQMLVKRGDRVKVGQVITILDSRDRLQKALLEAQKQVKVAEARLAQVRAGAQAGEIAEQEAEIARFQEELQGEIATQKATIARRQSELNVASAEYNRYLLLYREAAIAPSELDQRRLTLGTVQAQLNEAKGNQNRTAQTLRAQIRGARATLNQIAEVRPLDVQVAQAEMERVIAAVKRAESDLTQAYIRAPMVGRVLEIHARPGEAIGEDGIADLGETDQMEVVAEVYQTDIGKIPQGQQAIITSESFSGELHGTVRQIGLKMSQQEVFSNQLAENLARKVVEVRIHLNPEDSKRVVDLTNLQVEVAIQLRVGVVIDNE